MLMASGGRNNGKKQLAIRIVKQTMDLIHLLTGKNPIQVTLDSIGHCGPREDSTRIGSGGVVRRQAVDVSPLRRVNQAIYYIVKYARESAFRSLKSISECLADEIIKASMVSFQNSDQTQLTNSVVVFRDLPETQLPSERRMKSRESLRVTDEHLNTVMITSLRKIMFKDGRSTQLHSSRSEHLSSIGLISSLFVSNIGFFCLYYYKNCLLFRVYSITPCTHSPTQS